MALFFITFPIVEALFMGVWGAVRFVQGRTAAGVAYCAFCALLLLMLIRVAWLLHKDREEHLSTLAYPLVVGLFIFGFTALFFLDGGTFGGVPALFILAMTVTPCFLLPGEGVVLLCVELAAYGANIYLSFKYHDIVHTHMNDMSFIVPLLMVALVLGGLTLMAVFAYHRQQAILDKALLDANSANTAKSTFLDNMSHEIRTPMNSILGMNEMILREEDRPEIKEYALTIQRSGRALLGIINDILDYSKIQDNRMEINPIHYDLSSLINDMVNIGAEQARKKSLAFKVNVDKAIPRMLSGDEFRIRQVLLNILSNAVKFTERGSVTLGIGFEKVDSGTILLKCAISDTGVGIKDEDIDYIFRPFEHVSATRTMQMDGSGLGLAIVRNLLQLMHCDLKVESVYRKGSTFSFELPQAVMKWEPVGDYDRAFSVSNAHQGSYREAFQAPDANVLVVDDADVNLLVFANLLKKTRVRVETATSGAEMLQLVRMNHYDIIFLDHRMPGMDGIEAFHAMKTIPNNLNANTPVIAFTANAVLGARQMYLDEGFNDYISKPVDTVRLEQLLLSYLPPEKIKRGDQMEPDDFEPEKTKASAQQQYEIPRFQYEVPEEHEEEPEEAASPYANIPGIDYDAAVTNCGSEETFVAALQIFYETLDQKAGDIEKFEKEKDIRNYTILVHALKSAARLVGALQLSADAKYLEDCGNAQNVEEIEAKTPALLSQYRDYKEILAPVFGKEEDDSSLPEIPADDLHELYGLIKGFAADFDLDNIDKMLEEVKGYRIPDAEKEKFNKIKDCVTAADWGTLEQLLS
ncbi:MAG: response regulator [Fretibacterium sp.]|nr:response regulator [Fretibacterium sp.]